MVSDSGGHRGSTAKRAVEMAVVIPSEIKSERCFQVFPLFAEGVGQARQAPNLHSHGQVGSFDMRRTNPFGIGIAPHGLRGGFDHFWWRISVFFVGGCSIDFDELREVYPRSQAGMDCVKVRSESIGGDLEVSRSSPFQFFREGHRVPCRAPSQVPSQNQPCVALNGDEAIGVPALRVITDVALLFAPDKAPHFITLNIGNGKIDDAVFQHPLALISHENEQGKYCGVMYARQTLDRANRATFGQKLYNLGRILHGRIHTAQRSRVILCEGFAALLTAKALKTVAVLSKFLTAGIAVVARHYEPCLSLAIGSQWSCVDSCEESLGFQAPFSIAIEGGAFFSTSLALGRTKNREWRSATWNFSRSLPTINGYTRNQTILNFIGFHSFKSGRNGRQGICRIATKVKSRSNQPISDVGNCEPIAGRRLKYLANRLREAARDNFALFGEIIKRICKFLTLVIGKHVGGSSYKLVQLGKLDIYLHALSFKLADSLKGTYQNIAIIFGCHRLEYRHVYNKSQELY
jgi:hypothetical protein